MTWEKWPGLIDTVAMVVHIWWIPRAGITVIVRPNILDGTVESGFGRKAAPVQANVTKHQCSDVTYIHLLMLPEKGFL